MPEMMRARERGGRDCAFPRGQGARRRGDALHGRLPAREDMPLFRDRHLRQEALLSLCFRLEQGLSF